MGRTCKCKNSAGLPPKAMETYSPSMGGLKKKTKQKENLHFARHLLNAKHLKLDNSTEIYSTDCVPPLWPVPALHDIEIVRTHPFANVNLEYLRIINIILVI